MSTLRDKIAEALHAEDEAQYYDEAANWLEKKWGPNEQSENMREGARVWRATPAKVERWMRNAAANAIEVVMKMQKEQGLADDYKDDAEAALAQAVTDD